MGKIFEYFGFIFYFFSNEHEPVHVHVKHGSEECFVYRRAVKNTRINKRIRKAKED